MRISSVATHPAADVTSTDTECASDCPMAVSIAAFTVCPLTFVPSMVQSKDAAKDPSAENSTSNGEQPLTTSAMAETVGRGLTVTNSDVEAEHCGVVTVKLTL